MSSWPLIRRHSPGRPPTFVNLQPGKADLRVFAAALLAGSGWLFSTNALQALPPLFFIGSRFLLAGLIIFLFAGLPKIRLRGRELLGLVMAASCLALSMIAWIIGLKHTSNMGVAAFITATGNLLVPIVGAGLFRWHLPGRLLVSFSLALGGLIFLFLDTSSKFDSSHLFFIFSAFLWAVSIAAVKQSNARIDVKSLTSIQLGVSGLIILAAALVFEDLPATLPSNQTFIWFLLSVLLSTCARFTLQFQGQRAMSAGRGAVLMAFEPIWTMILSIFYLGASLSFAQAAGCSIIFAAIVREVSPSSDASARGDDRPILK
ncbi:DMT family transporter [Rhizobium sp. ICMP 5592]|uniref:DMT family transporter n=1 Tax=Rhizobium sp. ICMP 5592 TaxID=2292445 RepID=UPI0012962730|nr:DMT family transporter [Rhizobium sp. ICMP 5592]MQB46127.1 DMT family transporter [Rhizobium sp. ICMP 5592]